MMLTRRRDPSPCTDSGEGGPRSGTVALAALPRPVAVVVGAGGVRGAVHAGVGHALEQRGFRPDMITGTSVGALNGAIAAARPDRAAPWLEHVWTQLCRRDVYQPGFPATRAGISTDRGLRRQIERDLAEVSGRLPTVALPAGTDVWPAPWDFRHSKRLIEAASAAAGRFLDELSVDEPVLCRAGHDAVASVTTWWSPRPPFAGAGL